MTFRHTGRVTSSHTAHVTSCHNILSHITCDMSLSYSTCDILSQHPLTQHMWHPVTQHLSTFSLTTSHTSRLICQTDVTKWTTGCNCHVCKIPQHLTRQQNKSMMCCKTFSVKHSVCITYVYNIIETAAKQSCNQTFQCKTNLCTHKHSI